VTIARTRGLHAEIVVVGTDPRDVLPIRICRNLSPDGIGTIEMGGTAGTETVEEGQDRDHLKEEIGAEIDRLGNRHRDEIETERGNGTEGVTELQRGKNYMLFTYFLFRAYFDRDGKMTSYV
jgi:hypothetical protein